MKPDMNRAIREGRKTQTRRLQGLDVINEAPDAWYVSMVAVGHPERGWYFKNKYTGYEKVVKPRYRPGETVYVKEACRSWCIDGRWAVRYKLDNSVRQSVIGADENTDDYYFVEHEEKWDSPMFMPEWAARTHLLILTVEPQRLQDITPEDCEAEGIISAIEDDGRPDSQALRDMDLVDQYHRLWDSINPKYPWASNPWLWKITYKKVEGR